MEKHGASLAEKQDALDSVDAPSSAAGGSGASTTSAVAITSCCAAVSAIAGSLTRSAKWHAAR
jgi:hypothetical protein